MAKEVCIVFFYRRTNRYSINALLSALQAYNLLASVDVALPQTEHDLLSKVLECSTSANTLVVAVPMFSTQIEEVKHLPAKVRAHAKFAKSLLLVAGGPHPSGLPKHTLHIGFDFVFRGEAENSFPQFIKYLLKGGSLPKGIACLAQGRVVFTGRASKTNLDAVPAMPTALGRLNPIEITRGCPFGCKFCQTPQLFGGKIRHRSVERIVDAVEYQVSRGATDVRFITPNALSYGSTDGRRVNLSAVEELLSSVRKVVGKRGRIFFGSFPSEVRPEQVSRDALELIKRYANNDNLVIGAQTGSNRLLESINRQHTVEDVIRAVKLCVEFGFLPNVDFIFGLPGATAEDDKETVKVMRQLVKMGARIHAHTFMPLPQTAFWKSKPSPIREEILQAISELLPNGALFGSWRKQAKIAETLQRLAKSA